jgi:ABC-type sugar transport system ATPase subunit
MLGNTRLELTGRPAQAAAERKDGADLLIGFRPEDLVVLGSGDGNGVVRIPAEVDVVEYLGHEELVHARAEGHDIVALIPSDKRVAPGDKVELGVPNDKLHVFDPESEQSLVA